MKLNARIALAVMRLVYWLLLRWDACEKRNVPLSGPVILIANHVHLADPILLMLVCPRPITFLAKEQLFRIPFIGLLMRDAGMFSVARTGSIQQLKDVMRHAEVLLRENRVLALFPEGRRSRTGVLLEGKAGAAALSIRTGAPVVPVGIIGMEQLYQRWWWLKRPKITVIFGSPLHIASPNERLGRRESARLTTELMQGIAKLLPGDRRGPYGNLAGT